jgi:hypothetical protein
MVEMEKQIADIKRRFADECAAIRQAQNAQSIRLSALEAQDPAPKPAACGPSCVGTCLASGPHLRDLAATHFPCFGWRCDGTGPAHNATPPAAADAVTREELAEALRLLHGWFKTVAEIIEADHGADEEDIAGAQGVLADTDTLLARLDAEAKP